MYATGNRRHGGPAQDDTLHGRRILSNTLRQSPGKVLARTRLAQPIKDYRPILDLCLIDGFLEPIVYAIAAHETQLC